MSMSIEKVVAALKQGKKVTFASNEVSAEGVDYEWQTPSLRINHENGSSYKAGYRELLGMVIH